MDETLELNCEVPRSDLRALEIAQYRPLPREIEIGTVVHCQGCNRLIRGKKEGKKRLYCAQCLSPATRVERAREGALKVVGSTIGGREARGFARHLSSQKPPS